MDTRDAPSPALLDAFWHVVARHGWHGTTFARIAEESSETLSDLRGRYATPVDLLRAHSRVVDQAVLEGTVPGQSGFGTARDRVFDLLMRRFDALAPHRDGILRLQRDLMRDPFSALLLSPILMASMAWTLEGAGVSTAGIAGALRVQGLTGVWISAARAWEGDE
ncbi:MAG TPA: TetR family transcriptional regulator, partial [Roseomonas sp.]